MVTENRGKSKTKSLDQNRGFSSSKSKPKYKNFECNYCGKKGRIKQYCFKLKKENKGNNKQENKGNDKENDHVAAATSDDLLVVYGEDGINLACDETSWVVDSGAIFHVTSRKEFFTSYILGDFRILKMGNDGLSKAVVTGTVCLETSIGTKAQS